MQARFPELISSARFLQRKLDISSKIGDNALSVLVGELLWHDSKILDVLLEFTCLFSVCAAVL